MNVLPLHNEGSDIHPVLSPSLWMELTPALLSAPMLIIEMDEVRAMLINLLVGFRIIDNAAEKYSRTLQSIFIRRLGIISRVTEKYFCINQSIFICKKYKELWVKARKLAI